MSDITGFDISSPVELLAILDDDVLSGKVKLHGWQIQLMEDFASRDWTSDVAYKAVVRACNGSGKDKYIIASCVVWFAMKYPQAVSVVTSSSGTQLDRQTNTYIKQLTEQANVVFGQAVWKINYRHYECLVTKSTIELFVTDEAGRAEGWHPIIPNGKLAVFTSESKSIPDEIFTALSRCTGFTHRVDVSSPGLPIGHFFNICTTSRNRKDIASLDEVAGQWIEYHVTAYECSHLSRSYIEDLKRTMPGGESGAAFKSCVLAEFGTTDEMVVIPYTHIWRSINNVKLGHLADKFNTGGLDLSAGGDETVFSIRNGNKLIAVIPFRFDNTQDTIAFLEDKFKQYEFNNPNSYIYADAGGLGKPIIDQLRSRGWTNIRYILNQSKPRDERVYINRGVELWFQFGKLLESGEVWLLNDDKLSRQLATRYYKITPNNRHQLESKLQARAKGHPSPDRADSVVLCFSTYKTKLEHVTVDWKPYQPEIVEPIKPDFTLQQWAKGEYDEYRSFNRTNGSRDFSVYRKQLEQHNSQIKELAIVNN